MSAFLPPELLVDSPISGPENYYERVRVWRFQHAPYEKVRVTIHVDFYSFQSAYRVEVWRNTGWVLVFSRDPEGINAPNPPRSPLEYHPAVAAFVDAMETNLLSDARKVLG